MKINQVVQDPHFINTDLFSEEAIRFMKNKEQYGTGFYINDPEESPYYDEYWNEQTRRCIEGYTVGGVRITGQHYFYLNFCPIMAYDDKAGKIKRKTETFPKFWDLDWVYFTELELARQNGEGMIVAKARRKGFSYKNAAVSTHTYLFYRSSTTVIAAYLDKYANIPMSMTLSYINFIDQHTAWYRRRLPDTSGYIKAQYEFVDSDGRKSLRGYKSSIQKVSFKDNFSASIGQSADLMLFEEAGKWPNLIDSYIVSEPLFRDGDVAIGQPIIFGTGGDMDRDSVDFAEMFYSPQKYRLRSYENNWDDDGIRTVCGLFIPDYLCYNTEEGKVAATLDQTSGKRYETIDKEGNSNIEITKEFLQKKREMEKKTSSKSQWERLVSQSPFTPKEAFLKSGENIFPVLELSTWLGKIETTEELRSKSRGCELVWTGDDKNPVNIVYNTSCKPILKYPLKSNDDKLGCIVIYEEPYKDAAGLVPNNLYLGGTDPVDHDEAESSASLGSTIIYKTFNKFGETYNVIVAEYTGRPETAFEYYENVRKLCTLYNAQTLYENNLKGLKTHFEMKKSLGLLKTQPGIMSNMVKDSKVQRGYGIHMSKEVKKAGELYIRDWLLEPRGFDNEDNQVLNLHTILSPGLLMELINYSKDEGNFDRVIALMLALIHSQDNYNVEVKKQKQVNSSLKSFFNSSMKQSIHRSKRQPWI